MPRGNYRDLLRAKGFRALLATQFLGAFNDNLFKIVVSLLAVKLGAGQDGGSGYLALAGALFITPYLLFSGYAGHLADAFAKRRVLIAVKACEIVIMGLGVLAFMVGSVEALLGVLFLMATQSAFFSPAKYGILPEIFRERDLTRANGLGEMATFVAIILGTTTGGLIFAIWADGLVRVGFLLVAVAALGVAASFGIPRVPGPTTRKPLALSPFTEIGRGLGEVRRSRGLAFAIAGITGFWFLGALLQLDVILLGKEVMGLDDARTGLLQAAVGIGIAIGSLAAGRLSGEKIELGLVPLGGLGLAVGSLLLAIAPPSFAAAAASLVFIGFSGGLFIVPLNAFLQHKAGAASRGRLIATNNFVNMVGILIASGTLWLLRGVLGIEADRIVLLMGLGTLAGVAYTFYLLPGFFIRFTFWLLTHAVFRIRLVGREHVPEKGPALIVCNHLSFADGLLVSACVQRFVRFIVNRHYAEKPAFRRLARTMHVIPVSERRPKDIVRALARARAELEAGHVVCIFAEGAISRTGNPLAFRPGLERILAGLDVPVIPVNLDRVWGSIFSFKGGRFFRKWPERFPYPVTVSFGAPLPATAAPWQVRQAVLELGTDAFRHRHGPRDLLHLRFLAAAKRRWRAFCIADSMGTELTYGRALVGALLLARRLRSRLQGETMAGIMLPASAAGALANLALLFAGKVPVNLNFMTGRDGLAAAIERTGIEVIVTSRRFLDRAKLELSVAQMVFVEDLLGEPTRLEKLAVAAVCRLLPGWLLSRVFGRADGDPDSLATVLFTSGSSGAPKGVMLSHHNILSNVEAVAQVFPLATRDRMMCALPFFHSFGLLGGLWIPLLNGLGAVYHPNPLDAKAIGPLTAKHAATMLISTPTFCRAYLRSCAAGDFASLRPVIVGAEPLDPALAGAFAEKFGVALLEGYGCTEMAPVVSVNTASVTHWGFRQTGAKPGTAGHPLPGVAAMVVGPESGRPLPPGEAGLLLLKGAGRMLGYLDEPERTAEALRDGWYVTGDIAAIDEDGFIRVTDRLSRFSKIAGEMVPHVAIEQAGCVLDGVGDCAVAATPDDRRGERVALFYVGEAGVTPDAVWQALNRGGLAKLWLPRRGDVHRLNALPRLGTGKVDMDRLKALAADLGQSPRTHVVPEGPEGAADNRV